MNPQHIRILAEIAGLQAELEAMKVDNAVKALQGEYPNWGFDDFRATQCRFEALGQEALQYGQG